VYGKRVDGTLGTWARDCIPYFTNKEAIGDILLKELRGIDVEVLYVTQFFSATFPQIFATPYSRKKCVDAVAGAIRRGVAGVKGTLLTYLYDYPGEWQQEFVVAFADVLPDKAEETIFLPDGTLLCFPVPKPPEDEIPF
jgi:hypothetical protein